MTSYTNVSPPLFWHISVSVPPAAGATNSENDSSAPEPAQEVAQIEHFLCSSDPALVQLDALHDAISSDLLWWAKPMSRPQLIAMVNNSVCLGVYRVANPGDDGSAEKNPHEMVGFARLITDRVTFAYLTDVYILPAYQRRGLGAWMIRCLHELCAGSEPEHEDSTPVSTGWPNLRSIWLIASTPSAARMYMGALGAEEAGRYRSTPGVPDSGMVLLEMPGPANNTRQRMKAVKPDLPKAE
ncbi:hypothetical protein SEPCBS57363_005325 [Sporothrix epigloea]|uniref:N-acetyltransferase domain-containing protein n=1 Tax=Sporothrix epigloea TaxID=1892477 RepID=A0ABP0DY29_9PEZI